MARATNLALTSLFDLLRGSNGVAKHLTAIRAEKHIDRIELPDPWCLALNASIDLEDKAIGIKYPQILVHAGKTRNLLTEKFRKFSGVVEVVVEIRVSSDKLNLLDRQSLLYTDVVTGVLEDCRGEWGDCVFYSGRYEAESGPAKKGGKHFVQVTRISVPVDVSLG